MANTKKLIQAAAGAAGGAALNVEDVFSTYLYTGTAATLEINNGVDLDGEGGLVWLKSRDNLGGTSNNVLLDTERGANTSIAHLQSDSTSAASTGYLTSFDSDGFTIASSGGRKYNTSGGDYASWTFRKAPKFFDVVTYTGDGVAGRTVSHNLGSVPGCIIIKELNNTSDWIVYHRGIDVNGDNAPETDYINLNKTSAAADGDFMWNDTAPTDTDFTLGYAASTNQSGYNFVAYLFAHNDGDGEFGPDGDADIIKCGSYSINASDHVEDLGFEPQWVMTKSTNIAGSWIMVDNMRGMGVDRVANQDQVLRANITNAEATNNGPVITPTGFVWPYDGGNAATNGEQGIYIAIRRGPMAVPESATDVFDINTAGNPSTDPSFTSGFVTDMSFNKFTTLGTATYIQSRLQGAKYLFANTTAAESTASSRTWDYMDGWGNSQGTDTRNHSWMWKRAPNYFDVVAYTGNGTAGRTVSHNLGVAPEMIWIKDRDGTNDWIVYHSGVSNSYGRLTTAAFTSSNVGYYFGNNDQTLVSPTDSVFTIGGTGAVNTSNRDFIAYLFASLDGISKVGSYTGNGTNQDIDCGFSSGARFVLIKPNRSGDAWYVWDSTRGIVSGNDPFLLLNTTDAEITGADYIDPYSGGFNVTGGAGTVNRSGIEHIFYAIA